VNELKLAWQLAEIAHGQLSRRERDAVYVAISDADAVSAIGLLIQVVVRAQLLLEDDLVDGLHQWLAGYNNHPQFATLGSLISEIVIRPSDSGASAQRMPFLTPVKHYRRRNRT
jgi:hypothetical protein